MKPQGRVLLRAGLAMWALTSASSAEAHDSRPVAVQIHEIPGGLFRLHVAAPPVLPAINQPTVSLAGPCQSLVQGGGIATTGALYQCDAGIGGNRILVQFPIFNPSLAVIIRIHDLSGGVLTHVLQPGQTTWVIPSDPGVLAVPSQYWVLGAEHIVAGYDHLAFLICLLFLARTWRRVFLSVTGFTIGHSLTLGLATVGMISVPIEMVEACIALSIVVLAAEIARGRRNTLVDRFPVSVCALFGLIHGLGFAAALREVGLPNTELVTALLAFNIGVESGQLVFVACCVIVGVAVHRVFDGRIPGARAISLYRYAEVAAVYSIGSLAAAWTLTRIA